MDRNGHDWSGRFPLISEAALRNRNSSFVLDGEAVLLGVDGRDEDLGNVNFFDVFHHAEGQGGRLGGAA